MSIELAEKIRSEVRIRGKILHDSGDLKVHFLASDNMECFSDGIDVPEKFARRFFVDYHGIWFFESGIRIAVCERQVKHIEDILIRPYPFIEEKFLFFDSNHNIVVLAETGGRFDFKKFIP